MKTKSIVAFLIAAFMLPSVASAQFGKIIGKIGNNKTLNNNKPTNEVGVKGTAGGVNYVMTGRINHDDYDKTQTATVSFSRIPETLEEFLELQEKLGVEPQGAIALQVIAFEMYRRDKTVGTEAIRANNTQTNFSSRRSLERIPATPSLI